MKFTDDDLHLVREWYDSCRDLNAGYLEEIDHALARRIYAAVGMRFSEPEKAAANP